MKVFCNVLSNRKKGNISPQINRFFIEIGYQQSETDMGVNLRI